MSRQRSNSSDSLDLLLDTICNTFGGVVFIALLVVVMLRLTPVKQLDPATTSRAVDVVAARWQRVLRQHHDRLGSLRRELQASLAGWDEDFSQALDALEQLEHETLLLRQRVGDTLLTISMMETETANTQADTDRLTEARRTVEAEKAAAEAALEATVHEIAALQMELAVAEASLPDQPSLDRPIGLPTERADTNQQVGLFLKYGRVYFVHEWERGRNPDQIGPNVDDFTVQPGWLFNTAKPKPHRGIPIDAGGGASPALARRLEQFPATNWFIVFVVCEDSFDYFQSVKAQLVELGYRYYLFPLAVGESVWTAAEGVNTSQ